LTDQPFRVLPRLEPDSEFFWTSGRDGALRFLRCGDCEYLVHPPTPVCPKCLGRNVGPSVVSGRGTVFSCTVNHHPWDGSTEPWAIALVEIEEQADVRLTTNIVGIAPDDIRIGMPVRVVFEDHDPIFVPLFEPAP
jgi:uncharacterized OB-fold protein